MPGLRKRHILIILLSAYTLQAIATADGPFRLNHRLFAQLQTNGQSGWARALIWMDRSSDQIDKWSIDRFGRDPWAVQGNLLGTYTNDCVTAPSPGRGYLTTAQISLFKSQQNANALGPPLCKTIAGKLRYTTNIPGQVFDVNPKPHGTIHP